VAYMSCNPATLLEDLPGLLGLSDRAPEEGQSVPDASDAAVVEATTRGFDDHKPARPRKPVELPPGTSYRVVSLQLYDMFPQTRHWETLVLLEAVEDEQPA